MDQMDIQRRPTRRVGQKRRTPFGGFIPRAYGFQRRRRSGRYSGRGRVPRRIYNQITRNALMLRKLKKEEDEKFLERSNQNFQIPIAGAGTMDGIGPYMTQGITASTRIGNKITLKKMWAKFEIKLIGLEALGTYVRLLLIYDRKLPGAAGAHALPTAVTEVLTSDSALSGYNTTGPFRGRFQFLMDELVFFDSTEGVKGGKFYIEKPLKVIYDAVAGNVGDIANGHFFLLGLARANAAAITITWSVKFTYTDA